MAISEKNESLENIRLEIDRIDKQIIDLLSRRLTFAIKTANYKKFRHSLLDEERYKELIAKRKEWSLKTGLDPAVIEEIFTIIHEYCHKEQEKFTESHSENC
jgi:chorismate mutase